MFPSIATILSILAVAGCGGGSSPTGAGNKQAVNTVTLSDSLVEFGRVCEGVTEKRTVTITADESNTADVTGEIEAITGKIAVTSGSGTYTLAPGESHQFTLTFSPPTSGPNEVTIPVGVGDAAVAVRGYVAVYGYAQFTAAGESFKTTTNLGSKTHLSLGSGVSYGSPSWSSCYSGAWVMNGNGITESAVDITFDAPSGINKLYVKLYADAEGTCVQLLIEVDGDEHRVEGISGGCTEVTYQKSIAPGSHTLRIGTDQQGLCTKDLAIDWIFMEMRGTWCP